MSDSEIKEICRVTGEKKKGPAIRKLLSDAMMLKRRALLSEKFIAGEWGVELATYESAEAKDRRSSRTHAKAWRK